MEDKIKKINPVPKRKVYVAWVLVLGLAAVLITLSFFLQSKYQSRFSASATVQINTKVINNVKCNNEELALQGALGFDISQGVVSTDQSRYLEWVNNKKKNGGLDYTPTYEKWKDCVSSSSAGSGGTTGTPTDTGTGVKPADTASTTQPQSDTSKPSTGDQAKKEVKNSVAAVADLFGIDPAITQRHWAAQDNEIRRQWEYENSLLEYERTEMKIDAIGSIINSGIALVKDISNGDWESAASDFIDGWHSVNILNHPELAGYLPTSRESLEAEIAYNGALRAAGLSTDSLGGSSLYKGFSNGSSGLFSSSGGGLMQPVVNSDGTVSWQGVGNSDGTLNTGYTGTLSEQQRIELQLLLGKIITQSAGDETKQDGYLYDSNGDNVPDTLATSDNDIKNCKKNHSKCYKYYEIEGGEFLYLPYDAFLDMATTGPVSMFVARTFEGTKYYAFMKGPADNLDQIIDKLTGMIVVKNNVLQVYKLNNDKTSVTTTSGEVSNIGNACTDSTCSTGE